VVSRNSWTNSHDDERASGHSLHTLMYGIEGARRSGLPGGLRAAHSHLERITLESVVKGEDDPIDEVCCDKSEIFFFFSVWCLALIHLDAVDLFCVRGDYTVKMACLLLGGHRYLGP